MRVSPSYTEHTETVLFFIKTGFRDESEENNFMNQAGVYNVQIKENRSTLYRERRVLLYFL